VFAEALKVNTALETLNLLFSNIRDVGATAIAEALKINTALKTLMLSFNQISDSGATAIAKAMEVNTVLISLHLDDDTLQDRGILDTIAESCRENASPARLAAKKTQIADNNLASRDEL